MTIEQVTIKDLSSTLVEQIRLRTLSNEELVRDYLGLNGEDDQQHVNEMMARLWPEWETVEL